jgi:hypothetical protein
MQSANTMVYQTACGNMAGGLHVACSTWCGASFGSLCCCLLSLRLTNSAVQFTCPSLFPPSSQERVTVHISDWTTVHGKIAERRDVQQWAPTVS